MKASDRLLIGIVAGIVVLITAALIIALTKPEPTYLPEDTPEGVAYNDLFTLQKEDYAKAYAYLSPTLGGFPETEEDFIKNVRSHGWDFRLDQDSTLSLEGSTINGSRANVTIQETWFSGGDFFKSNQYTNTFTMQLRQINGEWKVEHSDYYYAQCWNDETGCPKE